MRVDQRQPVLRALGHRDRDRAVELDHRARLERLVERGDARPVGDRRDVLERDRRLHPVLVARRAGGERAALLDLVRVPQRAVLVVEQHQPPVGVDARVAARVVQEHQREQPARLGPLGHQLGQQAAEPDRLRAQLAPHERLARGRRVALVEDQVDRGEHRRQPVRQLLVLRHPVGDAGVGDLALGAHEPLGHRRLGDEERARDLRHRQPAERAQRERHARLGGERRVAAGEHQPQAVVGHLSLLLREGLELAELRRQHARPPQPVDRLVPRGGGDPRTRIARDALDRPALERDEPRILDRLLGEVEVAEDADQGGDRSSRLLAGTGGRSRRQSYWMTGRTSTHPFFAPGIFAAQSIASSRSLHSSR